jgi:hypothetical protein
VGVTDVGAVQQKDFSRPPFATTNTAARPESGGPKARKIRNQRGGKGKAAEAQQPGAASPRDHRPPTPRRPRGRGTGIASAPNRLPPKPVTPHRARPPPRSPEPPPRGPPDRSTRANSRQGQPSEGRPSSRRQGQGEPAAEILHLATAGGAESSDPHRPLHRRRGLSPAASLGAAERRGRRGGGWRRRDLGFASSVAKRGRREESETVLHPIFTLNKLDVDIL